MSYTTLLDLFNASTTGATSLKIDTGALVVSNAPVSDTGQAALAVRVISQLGASGGAGGGLTDTQLRASAVPVSWSSQTVTATQATGSNLHVVVDTAPSTAVTNAGTFAVQAASTQSGTWTVQPGNTANTTAWKVDGSAVTQPVSGTVTVTPPTLTKGTQGATGFSVQNLKDAGRNQTNFFMVLPIITTATDALVSLTGYKSGAAVGTTTTPAVVTSGKIYHIVSVHLTYVAIATAGTCKFTLRANTGGTVVIGSPAVINWVVGGTAAVAGISQSVIVDFPDGIEFAAGTGIGLSIVGLSTTQTAAAVGYGLAAIHGFEY